MADDKIKQILEIILEDKASDGLRKLGSAIDDTGKKSKTLDSDFSKSMAAMADAMDYSGTAISGALGLVGTAVGVASAGIAALGVALIPAVSEASEAESSLNRMSGALIASGQYSDKALKSFEEFSSQMQKTTKYSDDQVQGLLSLSVNLGATSDNADDLVKAALGLSTALGIDAESAVMMLGKTLTGETSPALKKMGIDLSDLSEESLKSGAAIKLVGDRFSGLAENELKTFGGQMAATKNSFSDLLEEIGKIIISNPILIAGIEAIKNSFLSMTEWIIKNKNEIASWVNIAIVAFAEIGKIAITTGKYIIDGFGAIPYSIISVIEFMVVKTNEGLNLLGLKSNEELARIKKVWEDTKDSWASPFVSAQASMDEFYASLDKMSLSAAVQSSLDSTGEVTLKANAKIESDSLNVETIKLDTLDVSGEASYDWWDTFSRNMVDFFKSSSGQIVTSMFSSMKEGAAGAGGFISTTLGTIADSIIPGSGAFVKAVSELLQLPKEEMLTQIKSFFDEIPKIITTMASNAPALAAAINESYIKIMSDPSLWAEMIRGFTANIGPALNNMIMAWMNAPEMFIEGIPDIINAFIDGMVNSVDGIAQALYDAVVEAFSSLGIENNPLDTGLAGAGGSTGSSTVDDVLNAAITWSTGGLNKVFGFATGGKVSRVNSPISGKDVVPARLAQGELVIDNNTTKNLEDFLSNQNSGMSDAILMQILDAVQRPQTVETSVNIGTESLAKAIYQINKYNYRTA